MLTAAYVVVGAGITGAAIAAHLARLGVRPLVIDAGEPAGGATASSGGMVRAYDPDPVVADLAEASLRVYADPTAWISGTAPLRRTGAVTLAEEQAAPLLHEAARNFRPLLEERPSVVAGADEVLGVHTAGGAALVEPDAGWVNPAEVTHLMLRQARRDGGRLITGARVVALRPALNGVRLHTQQGAVLARTVVLALGAWAAMVPPQARPHVRVRTRAIQVSFFRRPPSARPHAAFIDLRTGGYAKPVDRHTSLIGAPLEVWDDPPDFHAPPDMNHQQHTVDVVGHQLRWITTAPAIRTVRSMDGYADCDELLVPTELRGVWLARAGSGSGVRTAPELGRRIAERLTAPSAPPAADPVPDLRRFHERRTA